MLTGQLSARERVALLLDPGEELFEYGAAARPLDRTLSAAGDGVVVGVGRVLAREAVIVAFDYSALGASQGVVQHEKTRRAVMLAERLEAPLFLLVEGGGARAQELDRFPFPDHQDDFPRLARLSGRVPLIGVCFGRAFAGHAIFLGECDVLIATPNAVLGMAGPPLVKAALGIDCTPEEIGSLAIHEPAGTVDVVAADDADAIAIARRYAGFVTCPAAADSDTLELRPAWAPAVRTSLTRIGARAAAIATASDALDGAATAKLTRFVSLCDAAGLPLVLEVDVPGFTASPAETARLLSALATARIAIVVVVTGRLGGNAEPVFGGAWEPVLRVWWPSDEAQARAERFAIDAIVEPADTRDALARVIAAQPILAARVPHRFVEPW